VQRKFGNWKNGVGFPKKTYKNGSCQQLFITREATTTATTTPIQQVSYNRNNKLLK